MVKSSSFNNIPIDNLFSNYVQVFRKVGKIRTVTVARKKDVKHSGESGIID